ELDDVAEFARERATARVLDSHCKIMTQVQKVKAGYRSFGDVDLEFGAFKHTLFRSRRPCVHELIDDPFSLTQDKKFRASVGLRARRDVGSADHHGLAM